jgi:UTP--glucose-1-phosphate uridylyltransferase
MQTSGDQYDIAPFILKMRKEGLPPIVIETFSHYYKLVTQGATGLLHNTDINALDPDELMASDQLKRYSEASKHVFKNTVMVKLNGGLGTSMGLTRAKSLLEIKNGKTFLEVILNQAETVNVTLALMNSFSTHEDTRGALSRLNPTVSPILFLQHKFPKILKDGFAPATWPNNPELEWNPPGHGDIYTALATSGMLQKLLDEDIKYAFISNSDNLGATLDESLLGYFSENQFPFMMEVAERTPSDLKGGHLARHNDGRLILREVAQCPQDELDAFEDIHRYRFFNTNNIWINLEFLKNLIEKRGTIPLPLILNPKFLDPRDDSTPEVFQVETAMGAAISLFKGATAVKVPRSRLIPVKKCNDLLAVRSDCFIFSENYRLIRNPDRRLDSIRINLDPKYYGKIDLFDARFKKGVPSLIDCESLTIEGDVFFEADVTLKGNVIIVNRNPHREILKEGSLIDRNVSF